VPYALRNRLSNPVLVHPHDQRPLIWRAAGDPSGEDIQMISDELRDDISIRRAIKLGSLELMDNEEEIDRAYEVQRTAGQTQASTAAQAIKDVIDVQSTENVMVGLPCIGPGTRAGVTCEQQAIVLLNRRNQIPPLCTEHASLAGQYALVDGGDQPNYWVRTSQ